jgi:hypothetical protein
VLILKQPLLAINEIYLYFAESSPQAQAIFVADDSTLISTVDVTSQSQAAWQCVLKIGPGTGELQGGLIACI